MAHLHIMTIFNNSLHIMTIFNNSLHITTIFNNGSLTYNDYI